MSDNPDFPITEHRFEKRRKNTIFFEYSKHFFRFVIYRFTIYDNRKT